MSQSHVLEGLKECEKIIERLCREQFEIGVSHAVKSKLCALDLILKENMKTINFIYNSEKMMR